MNRKNVFDGDEIPTKLLEDYCTNKCGYTVFMKFLKANKIRTPDEYKSLYEKNEWIPKLSSIREKYPKFNFQELDWERNRYYKTLDEFEKYSLSGEDIMIFEQKIKDKKIPNIDVELYYPKK